MQIGGAAQQPGAGAGTVDDGLVRALPPAAEPLMGVVPGSGPAVRIAILGESTAAGTGSPTHETSMAGHLARALHERDGREVMWRVLGRNGATARRVTRELVPRIIEDGWTPTHVVVLIGMNDVQRTWRRRTWERHIGTLLGDLARRCPDARVIVSGLPDLHGIPALARGLLPLLVARAQRMAAVTHAAARAAGAVYVPIDHIELTGDFLAADGMHPSPEGYRRWAAEVVPFLVSR
ncbi:SGNH/GDSL hydrolase family protein [Georgenia sp. AZ-5]|uniref:SGNH/GDSL hydrolase family protein n=1 Tax=Georgenia sp. AZ-5 TaxID=3367526 RepID=UPI00375533B2